MITRLLLYCCLLPACLGAQAQATPSPALLAEHMARAAALRQQPATEERFRATCDLAQAAALIRIDSGYRIIQAYLPLVQHNRQWTHILLMGWAKAELALGGYQTADSLYRLARSNMPPDSRAYREAMVASVLLWTEYEKNDSLNRYFADWQQLARNSGDNESLSFLYCFRTMGFYIAGQTDSMRHYFEEAIRLATPLTNKNALFTARYNYANLYLRNDPQQQVAVFTELWQLARDPSLARYPPKLYERTAFSFRNAGPSISYQLMQLNLLLTDYDAAGKYAREFYEATVTPNPSGAQAPFFQAEMAIVLCYQQQWEAAARYLRMSKAGFNKPEAEITYPGYFIAASLLAAQAGQPARQLAYIQTAKKHGSGVGLYLLPADLYLIQALIANGRLQEAEQAFAALPPYIRQQPYTAPGLFYYQHYAALKKAQGQLAQYTAALETYYQIKDSLLSFNRYRAIQEIMARMEVREREQQIRQLDAQRLQLQTGIRQERRFYGILMVLFGLIIVLLVLYLRLRQAKMRQQSVLHQHQLAQIEQQQRIQEIQSVMQAEERQRTSIAAALHNEVNALLSLSILNLSSELEKQSPAAGEPPRLRKALDGLVQVSQTVRNLSHRLAASVLAVKDLPRALQEMTDQVNISGKVQVELIVVGFDEDNKHSFTLLADMYAILQELLHNIIRHADARHALAEIVEHTDRITIMVEDDGVGMRKQPDGMGLHTIRQQVAGWAGNMEVAASERGGTLVVIEIPLHPHNTIA